MKNKNKIKLYDSFFDPETGASHVVLSTPRGLFSGYALCNYDEGDEFSELIGGSIAEIRAWIKYAKRELLIHREIVKEFKALYNSCRHYDNTSRKVFQKIEEEEGKILAIMFEIDRAEQDLKDRSDYMTKRNKKSE